MISLDDLRFIACLSRNASLAQAARALDVTPPALSLRLKGLESRIGTALVIRTTRRLSLTDMGELLAGRAEAILDDVEAVTDAVRGGHQSLSGRLRIVAPFGFGRAFVAPALATFAARHTAIDCELLLSSRPSHEHEAQFDVIVHVGELSDSSLVAYPLARNARWLCASPQYMQRHGVPRNPQELARHRVLALRENDEDTTLWRMQSGARVESVRVRPCMSTNDGQTLVDWAVAGLGVALRSEWDIAPRVATGELMRLLTRWRLPPADAVALVPARRAGSTRALAFVRHLQDRFRPRAPWHEA